MDFKIEFTVGKNRIVAHAVIDRKNNSIHLHLWGEMVGKKRMPIQVKNSDMEFKEGNEVELITKILTDHFLGQPVQVRRIEKLNDHDDLSAAGPRLRILVRLKD